MKCAECGSNTKLNKKSKYKYAESGLNNFILCNIDVYECPECGGIEAVIPDIEDLHNVLATIIARKKARLAPEEIRFLRTHLGFSSSDFAKVIHVRPETVSRWENGKSEMEPSTELLIRTLILTSKGPFRDYEDLKNAGTLATKKAELFKLELVQGEWKPKAA